MASQTEDPEQLFTKFTSGLGLGPVDLKSSRFYGRMSFVYFIVLGLDLIVQHTTFVAIPYTCTKVMLALGSTGHLFLGTPQGILLDSSTLFFRWSVEVMLFHLVFTNRSWLSELNKHYHRIESLSISPRMRQVLFCLDLLTYATSITTTCIIAVVLVVRSPRLDLGWQHSYGVVNVLGHLLIGSGVWITYLLENLMLNYLLITFLEQLNCKLRENRDAKLSNLYKCLDDYAELYLLTSNLCNSFLWLSYMIIVFSTLSISLPSFFGLLYVDAEPVGRLIFYNVLVILVIVLWFVSQVSGCVNNRAQIATDWLYHQIIFDPKFRARFTLIHHKMKIIEFFQCVDKNTFGLKIMNTPINAQTIIIIITLYFTLATFIGNQIYRRSV